MKILIASIYICAQLAVLSNAQSMVKTVSKAEIPNVAFCEMIKNPRLYFDQPIRISATFLQATEGAYLGDDACPLAHDDQIGAVFEYAEAEQLPILREQILKIGEPEYGGKARILAVGILRAESRRDFAWYKYRFDILRIEKISHVVVSYSGLLEGGTTYRAAIRFDKNFGITTVNPVQMPSHYGLRIEWANLADFPELKKLRRRSAERQIIFSVVSTESKQMTVKRWNMTIRCKIISVE
jgi:hypothetical protein